MLFNCLPKPKKPLWPFTLNDASVQSVGLAGWWPGGPSGGLRLFDRSTRGSNHGTLTNFASPFTTASGWAFGKDGGKGALAFDGTNDEVTASDAGFPSGSAPRTQCCWINPSALPGSFVSNIILWYGSNSTPNGIGLSYVESTGGSTYALRQFAWGSTNIDVTVGDITNRWTHLAGVWDGTNGIVYVNGGRLTSSGAQSQNTTLSGIFRLGHEPSGFTAYYPGMIEDTRIYNRALSAAEVAALYDPRTRWELRYVPGRVTYFVGSPAPPGGFIGSSVMAVSAGTGSPW